MKINYTHITIIILILLLLFQCNRTNKIETNLEISNQNNKALNDSVRISKTKNNKIEYSKQILVSENNSLKNLNKDLHHELKNEKGKVYEITKIVSSIKTDTIYANTTSILYGDTSGVIKWLIDTSYSDNNKRLLEGLFEFNIDSSNKFSDFNTIIVRDEIEFSLVTGLKEVDGKVEIFVRSDYPGLVIKELDGALVDVKNHPVLKKYTKRKKFGIGIIGGYGFSSGSNIGVIFGVGLSYNIIQF